jgi:hypothetical protein
MEYRKSLKDFPEHTQVRHTLIYKKIKYTIEGEIINGCIQCSLGKFKFPSAFVKAHNSNIKQRKQLIVAVSGWKVVYYKSNNIWLPLNSFFNCNIEEKDDEPDMCRVAPMEEPDVCRVVPLEEPDMCRVAPMEEPDVCRVVPLEEPDICRVAPMEEPDICRVAPMEEPDICRVAPMEEPDMCRVTPMEEPDMCRVAPMEEPNTSSNYKTLPILVSLPFNIGYAWMDSNFNVWEALHTQDRRIFKVGKYIGIYHLQQGFLSLSVRNLPVKQLPNYQVYLQM